MQFLAYTKFKNLFDIELVRKVAKNSKSSVQGCVWETFQSNFRNFTLLDLKFYTFINL